MPRSVSPEKWEIYWTSLQQGYGKNAAAKRAGISRGAARAFLNGDPTSSGMAWLNSHRLACPSCGCELDAKELVNA